MSEDTSFKPLQKEETIHNTDELKKQIIIVIMRQTDYSREQAEDSLLRNKTIEKCIEEYLGIKNNSETKNISTNQAIYKSIREWMK